MQALQVVDVESVEVFHAFDGCTASGHGCVIGNALRERRRADRAGVSDLAAHFAHGRDHEMNVAVLEQVDDMRSAVLDLVHAANRNSSLLDRVGRATGGHQFVAHFVQQSRDVDRLGLVRVLDAEEHRALARQLGTRAKL